MVDVSYFGGNSFQVKGKKVTLIIDPLKENAADIVLSTKPPMFSSDKQFVINGPGEYEVKGITVYGVRVAKSIIFVFSVDNVRFAHVSLQEKASSNIFEEIGEIDILFVSLNNADIIAKTEPKIVCLMGYKTAAEINDFIKIAGFESKKISGKLSVTKEKLPEQTTLYVFE